VQLDLLRRVSVPLPGFIELSKYQAFGYIPGESGLSAAQRQRTGFGLQKLNPQQLELAQVPFASLATQSRGQNISSISGETGFSNLPPQGSAGINVPPTPTATRISDYGFQNQEAPKKKHWIMPATTSTESLIVSKLFKFPLQGNL